MSQYKPTPAEISVLEKGLNFAIVPNCIPAKEMIKVTGVACQGLDVELAEVSYNKVVDIM